MAERDLPTGQLAWRAFRLTEKAVSLVRSGRLDDAISVVDNRERLLNLLATRADVSEADLALLREADKTNEVLLGLMVEVRERLREEISRAHKGAEAHRAYHSGQVK